MFLLVFSQLFKVNRFESFVRSVGVIGLLESRLVVNLTADSLVDGEALLIKDFFSDITAS